MDPKPITVLDGSEKEREKVMKDFFGLTPEQSFQDIEADDDDTEQLKITNKIL